MTIRAETERSVEAAPHLGDMDAGAVAVLLDLADAVDYLLAHEGLTPSGKLDNVSVPTFLRYCNDLGLTPAGREKLSAQEQKEPDGKLAKLRSIPKPKSA